MVSRKRMKRTEKNNKKHGVVVVVEGTSFGFTQFDPTPKQIKEIRKAWKGHKGVKVKVI